MMDFESSVHFCSLGICSVPMHVDRPPSSWIADGRVFSGSPTRIPNCRGCSFDRRILALCLASALEENKRLQAWAGGRASESARRELQRHRALQAERELRRFLLAHRFRRVVDLLGSMLGFAVDVLPCDVPRICDSFKARLRG
eukprot:RCo052513